MSIRNRLLRHKIADETTGCWNWNGYVRKDGYCNFKLDGKIQLVHRMAAVVFLGFDLNSDLNVLHKCDNRKCFNPEHLFIDTQSANVRDAFNKGRTWQTKVTHCPLNHPLSGDNLYIHPTSGQRVCRACSRKAKRRYRSKYNPTNTVDNFLAGLL